MPVRCSDCVGPPTYVWKYNMSAHYTAVHRNKTMPVEFKVSPKEKEAVVAVGKRAGKKA